VIKAELSTLLLQSSESHDPDELMLKKHFSLLSLSTIVLLLQYYSTKLVYIYIFISGLFDE